MKYQYLLTSWLLVISSLCSSETLNIVTIDLAPFGYRNADAESVGIFYEIANQVALDAGIEHRNNILPYARVVRELKLGKADVTILLPGSRIREVADPLERVIELESIVIGLPNSQFNHYDDLMGKTIGSIREAIYDQRISDDERITFFYTNRYQQSIDMLLAKRFDGIIGVKRSIYFELSRLGYPTNTLGSPMTINKQEAWLVLSRASKLSDKTIKQLREALVSLHEGRNIEQILKKYGNF